MIRFMCPKCSTSLKAPPDAAGKVARCTRCDTRLRVPGPEPAYEVVEPELAPVGGGRRAGEMTPAAAVARLAEIVAASPGLTEDGIYDALAAAGVPEPLADRAYKFTQIAWGRVFLDGMGIDLLPDYSYTTVRGRERGEALLADEPCYAAALRLAPRYEQTPAFQRLALTSAEVLSVNDALKRGSRPENLTIGSALVLIEAPRPRS
jgi:hypothetical protein